MGRGDGRRTSQTKRVDEDAKLDGLRLLAFEMQLEYKLARRVESNDTICLIDLGDVKKAFLCQLQRPTALSFRCSCRTA